jgi:catechol 2,3-dioxygenase-like lactoylglutathione lyase family enzyme
MSNAMLEHVNITVPDPEATARTLCEIFDWHIRWSGSAIMGGRSIHVGNDESYVALFAPDGSVDGRTGSSYGTAGALNHIGVTVEDLDATEKRVRENGFEPYSHAD